MGDSHRPSQPPPPRDRRRRGVNDDMPRRLQRDHHYEGTHGDGGFSFRGAASGRADNYRPQEQFTFQAPGGPSAPRFAPQQPPPRERPLPPPPGTDKRRDRSKNFAQGNRNKGGAPFQRRWVPKPAHSRDLLKHTDREGTPEQLLGMNADSQPRFEVNESSEDDSDADDSSDNVAADDGEGARKRTKTETTAEPARPMWSNPDPYSVLPPTDLGVQPKKDIVQTIRKAKADALAQGNGTNAISQNADFISFDFGDEADDTVGAPPPPPPDFVMPTDVELMESYTGGMDSRKRKRGTEAKKPATHAGRIVEEWQPNHTNPTPWMREDATFMSNVGLQLHKEIVDFYDYVRPYPHEAGIRRDLVDRIEQAVRSWRYNAKNVEIRSFGSFAAGLYLPVADMDLVAVTPGYMRGGLGTFCQSKNNMFALARHLEMQGLVAPRTLAVIAKAKVPIIKFVDAQTGIRVDISFENDSGLRAVRTFEEWKKEFPEMPVLVVLIKQLLAMRGLNEVFSGGIGGFTIICLVVSMLQLMPENQRGNLDERSRYGELLLNFLDLYGNKFDVMSTGIKMDPPGYFSKLHDHSKAKLNDNGLSIIDPNNPENDISGGSRKITEVLKIFSGTQTMIQQRLNDIRTGKSKSGSILECVLGGDYTSFEDQRVKLDRIDRASRQTPPPPPPEPRYQPARYQSPPSRAPSQQRQYSRQPPPPPPTRDYYNSFPQQPQYPQSQPWQTQQWPPHQRAAQPQQHDFYGGFQDLPPLGPEANKPKKAKKKKDHKSQKPAPKTAEAKSTTKSEKKKSKKSGTKRTKSKGSQSSDA